ncbi:MAG: class I SAM-dependent RNA methyltransferase [Myxococcota bacterium]
MSQRRASRRRREPGAAGDASSDADVPEVECEIETLAAGGDGVGRLPDGRALFVEGAAPGDRVRVRVSELRARYARGRVVRLLEPGPDRVEPACPSFGVCGGCSWQHIDYAAQVRAKTGILRDAVERIGHLACPDPIPFHASPEAYGYRLRARLLVSGREVGYRRRRSHAVCAVRECPVLEPALAERLGDMADDAASGRLGHGEWELFAGAQGPRVRRVRRGAGEPAEIEVLGAKLRISPGVFAQANRGLLDPLAEAVRRAVVAGRPAAPDGLLLELFAGAGFFTLGCAPHFLATVAVESDAAAVRDLRFNLARAGLGPVEVRAEACEAVLADWASQGRSPDVVLLDPPRAGLGREGVEALARIAPGRVVYLSCDPATLARDLARLCDDGYTLRGLEGFDLFPQTPHVEALAVIERVGEPPAQGSIRP